MEQRGRMQIVVVNTFLEVRGYSVGFDASEVQPRRRSSSCPPALASPAATAAPVAAPPTAAAGASDGFPMGQLVYWCHRDAAYGQRGVIAGRSSYFGGSCVLVRFRGHAYHCKTDALAAVDPKGVRKARRRARAVASLAGGAEARSVAFAGHTAPMTALSVGCESDAEDRCAAEVGVDGRLSGRAYERSQQRSRHRRLASRRYARQKLREEADRADREFCSRYDDASDFLCFSLAAALFHAPAAAVTERATASAGGPLRARPRHMASPSNGLHRPDAVATVDESRAATRVRGRLVLDSDAEGGAPKRAALPPRPTCDALDMQAQRAAATGREQRAGLVGPDAAVDRWEVSRVVSARDLGVLGFRWGDSFGPPMPLELAVAGVLGRVDAPERLGRIAWEAVAFVQRRSVGAPTRREARPCGRRGTAPACAIPGSLGLALFACGGALAGALGVNVDGWDAENAEDQARRTLALRAVRGCGPGGMRDAVPPREADAPAGRAQGRGRPGRRGFLGGARGRGGPAAVELVADVGRQSGAPLPAGDDGGAGARDARAAAAAPEHRELPDAAASGGLRACTAGASDREAPLPESARDGVATRRVTRKMTLGRARPNAPAGELGAHIDAEGDAEDDVGQRARRCACRRAPRSRRRSRRLG